MRVDSASRGFLLSLFLAGMVGVSATGCTPIKSWFAGKTNTPQSTPAKATEQPKPLVSNAFAYARFVALNLESSPSKELPPAEVERILLQSSLNSKISPQAMIQILSTPHTPSAAAGKSTSQLRFEEFQAQHNSCVAQFQSPTECCNALAWPLAVLPQLTSMDAERLLSLQSAAQGPAPKLEILKAWGSQGADAQPNSADIPMPGARAYRLAGLKAWLGACHVVLSGAPANLGEFTQSLGTSLTDKTHWSRVLHARSRAKRGPRRVFARLDGQISIAETLAADCSVKETEVIRRRRDGTLDYWVYDAQGRLTPVSHFPAPANDKGFVTVEKLSPDSCMGCHYSFDTRHFDQLRVSAEALRLPQTLDLPVVCLQPEDTLAEDN
ncbi:MAG: hypothetical protein RI932_2364 [Pseudomonadota bacterium]|jgi:hypothetical protein